MKIYELISKDTRAAQTYRDLVETAMVQLTDPKTAMMMGERVPSPSAVGGGESPGGHDGHDDELTLHRHRIESTVQRKPQSLPIAWERENENGTSVSTRVVQSRLSRIDQTKDQ